MGELLQDFSDSFDSTDCYLILYMTTFAMSLTLFIVSCLMIWIVPSNPYQQTLFIWTLLAWFSCFAWVVSLVLLVEPRPSHWLPSLQSMRNVVAAGDPRQCKQRLRAWWRWRNKYAQQQRTKLNV